MGYVEDNLLPDEKIITKAKIHWEIFVYPVILFLIGLLWALLVRVSHQEGLPYSSGAVITELLCIWSLPLLGIIAIITAVLYYLTTEFALTDKRIIAKVGILNQHSLEIMIQKIESIVVSQPILGRILNYGTIVVIGSGGTRQSFKNISNPMQLRQRINLQISKIAQ
jgi:uncharacterized membrane protein YdbT with pleckstrin-like domain